MQTETQNIPIQGYEYTPKRIADSETPPIKFKIPLYQRLFAWDEGKIKELLNDLYGYFKINQDKQMEVPYYLGIITEIKDGDYYLVIDGQQRLTVLMLMGMVFAGTYNNKNWAKFLCPGKDYEQIDVSENMEDTAKWGLRLFPFARKDDQKSMLELLVKLREGNTPKDINSSKISFQMFEAVKTIYNFMANGEKFDSSKREKFIEHIYKSLVLFATSLSESYLSRPDYLNKYFEIMNSNYKNLEQHEILKVKLLKDQEDGPELNEGPDQKDSLTHEERKGKKYLLKIWNCCENFSTPLYTPPSSTKDKDVSGVLCTDFTSYFKNASQILETKDKNTDSVKAVPPQVAARNDADKESLKELSLIDPKPAAQKQVREQGERSIINFSQFLLLALAMFLERKQKGSISCTAENSLSQSSSQTFLTVAASEEADRKFYNIAHLLENYGLPEGLKISADDIPEFYGFLFALRALLDFYVIRRADDAGDTYSVMCGKIKAEEDELVNVWKPEHPGCRLAQYQAMLDAAFPEYFYKWLKPYLSDLYEAHFKENGELKSDPMPEITAESLLKWLKNWDNKRALECANYNDIVIRQQAITNKLNPDKLKYGTVDRYWFWRLDYYLWENARAEIEKDPIFKTGDLPSVRTYMMRSNRSIEHLYPQNPGKDSDIWIGEDREMTLNSFGNLAMISSSFNSTQGNEDVRVKFSRVQAQMERNTLQSLKLLAMYNAGNGIEWTPDLAKAHQDRMIKILENSFA